MCRPMVSSSTRARASLGGIPEGISLPHCKACTSLEVCVVLPFSAASQHEPEGNAFLHASWKILSSIGKGRINAEPCGLLGPEH